MTMRSRPTAFCASALMAVLVSCTWSCGRGRRQEQPEIRLPAGPPMAVGARVERVAYLACPGEPGSNPNTPCERTGIARIESASVDDPAAFAIGTMRLVGRLLEDEKPFHVSIPIEAKAPAVSTLRVTVVDDNGRRWEVASTLDARAADRVELQPNCDNPLAQPPLLVGTSNLVRFDYALYSGSERLVSDGYLPIVGPVQPFGTPTGAGVTLRMPNTTGSITLTSPVDPKFALSLNVYDPDRQINGLTLQRAPETPPGPYPVQFPDEPVAHQVFPTVGGRAVCTGNVPVTIEIVDRHVCAFYSDDVDPDGKRIDYPRDSDFSVYGRNEGTCDVRATLSRGPTEVVARLKIPFYVDLPLAPGRFRWEAPLPQGNDLRSVFGFAPNDVWAVGWAGTILHFDGTNWSPVDNGLPRGTREGLGKPGLRALWGSAPNSLFAVGERGLILRWDGTAWSQVPSGTTENLTSVWGSGPNEAWAVSGNGSILRWNGSTWSPSPSGTSRSLMGVWSPGPGLAWAVGYDGTILHWNGSAWVPESGAGTESLFAVRGSGPDDVWALGVNGSAFRRTGGTWKLVPTNQSEVLHTLWVSSANDVWASGPRAGVLRWRDGVWSPVPRASTSAIYGIWGSGPDALWGVGHAGNLERWDGSTWTQVNVEPTLRADLRSMWTSPSGVVWATYGIPLAADVPGLAPPGSILRRIGDTWTAVPTGTNASFSDVWGTADDDVWAVGGGGTIVHWDGSKWSQVASNTSEALNGIWGSGRNDVWVAAGNSTVLHWNGSRWSAQQLESWAGSANPAYFAVWGAGPSDVWVVGSNHQYQQWTIWHYNGFFWRRQSPNLRYGATLYEIWGSSRNDVWAVGARGTVVRYDGSTWRRERTGLDRALVGVWGRGPDDVWVTGELDVIRWDGYRWSTVPSDSYLLTGIHGSIDGRPWLHGWDGALLRYTP